MSDALEILLVTLFHTIPSCIIAVATIIAVTRIPKWFTMLMVITVCMRILLSVTNAFMLYNLMVVAGMSATHLPRTWMLFSQATKVFDLWAYAVSFLFFILYICKKNENFASQSLESIFQPCGSKNPSE